MSDDRRKRRRLGASNDAQAKKILARSLYSEFVSNGWSRGSILEYVNIFLDLVITKEGGGSPQPVIDTETGFVTRQGFQELLRHELDPNIERKFSPTLLLFRVCGDVDVLIVAKILRNELRVGDVVAPLRNQLIAVVVQVPSELGTGIRDRLLERVSDRLTVTMQSAVRTLDPATQLRPLWTGMLREMKNQ